MVKTGNPNDKVYGVLYRIIMEKLSVLSTYEGIDPTEITIEADGVKLKAKAYIFETPRESGTPPDAYLNVMVTGLSQHGYPEEVIEVVKKIASLT